MDTPGVEILGPMHVFGDDDAPHGHMHLRFNDVRVPYENMLLGEGRGFEISQVRLGPGRIHHCMRSIGVAEKALELMVRRGLNREAFGKPLASLGKNTEVIAKARIEIEAMRLMVLRAAKAMDVMGNAEARVWVSAVKAMVPVRVCEIIDEAIQIHGATGVSQWTPLARMYTSQRTLRLADGPDEVHWHVVGRAELTRYEDDHALDGRPDRYGARASSFRGRSRPSMRHAVWTADGRLDVVDVEPPALAPGFARLAVEACGICGTDLQFWSRPPPPEGRHRRRGTSSSARCSTRPPARPISAGRRRRWCAAARASTASPRS